MLIKSTDKNIMFSVIVPIYKVEAFLHECIDSVLSQTYTNFELILVDDGSPDSCPAICDEYATCDSRIKVIHKSNGGLSSARNSGINIAKGNYFIFLDSDDKWANDDVLQKINNTLKSDTDVLVFNYQKFSDNSISKSYYSYNKTIINSSIDFLVGKKLWSISACNKVVLKKLFQNNQLRFREGITNEDLDWVIRLGLLANKVSYIPDTCLLYRQQRIGSITATLKGSQVKTFFNNIVYSYELISRDENYSQMPVLAYQYAVLIYDIAQFSNGDKQILEDVSEMSFLLKYGIEKKVYIMRFFSAFGIKFLILLLKFYKTLVNS